MRSLIRKKRGMLLASETVKIVIALIALVFLVYLLTSIYFAKTKEVKRGQAESVLHLSSNSLDVYIQIIRAGVGGDLEKDFFPILNPVGWYLFSFTGSGKPDSCQGKNCLCICDNVWWGQAKECGEEGICLVVEDLIEYSSSELELEITSEDEGFLEILIKKDQNKIGVEKK